MNLLLGFDGLDARGYRYCIRCRIWVQDVEKFVSEARLRLSQRNVKPDEKWSDYMTTLLS